MPAARIVPSRKLLLMALNETGSQAAVSELFGVHFTLVSEWCSQNRITRHDYNQRRNGKKAVNLTEEDAELIKQCEGSLTAYQVARKFDTTAAYIKRIWSGERWNGSKA